MDEYKIIEDTDSYCISFNEVDEFIKYSYYPSSSYMYFRWWDTSSVLKLLNRRLESNQYIVINNGNMLKTIPRHNNIYRDDATHFINYAYPKISEYLKSNGYKKLRKKDFNRKTLEKCNINYLSHLYDKVK